MAYRRLGNSNLRVSAPCLGTMMFGGQTALIDVANIVASARERGINFMVLSGSVALQALPAALKTLGRRKWSIYRFWVRWRDAVQKWDIGFFCRP